MSQRFWVLIPGGMLLLALAACGPVPEGGLGAAGASAEGPGAEEAPGESGEGEGEDGAACNQPHKVEICHIPPGNPDNSHTLCVGEPAVDAHLAHGDLLGACDDGGDDDGGAGDDNDDGSTDDDTSDDDTTDDDTAGDDQGYRGGY